MSHNALKEKNLTFAVRGMNLYKLLHDNRNEFVLGKQMLRGGTSIGANINEALCAESDKGFIHKLQIANKETNKTHYWFGVMPRSGLVFENEYNSINKDLAELLSLLTSIIKTFKMELSN